MCYEHDRLRPALEALDEEASLREHVHEAPCALVDGTLAREELGLNPGDLGSPWVAAISSFVAFALGAVVPLLPFVFGVAAGGAVVGSALLSAVALATVGAVISLFTGRPAWRSALRMVLIGGGAAAVTHLIGSLVGVTLD